MSPIDRLREQALRRRGPQTLPPPMPPVPTDAAFYADLPDLLQAQIFVALQTYNRKRTPQMPEERLLWAGTPHTRVRTMLLIFVVWVFIMFLPAFYLVEEVDEFGGWLALIWAGFTVFLFVPRISRRSRVVYAITTYRSFMSERTMNCAVRTSSLPHDEVIHASVAPHAAGVATVEIRGVPTKGPGEPRVLRFGELRDVDSCTRLLGGLLPKDILERAGGLSVR